MKKSLFSEAEKLPLKVEAFRLSVFKNIELIHISLKPGELIEKHAMDFSALFFVLGGNGLFLNEAGETWVKENEVIQVESNEERGWLNNSGNILKLLLVKIL